MQYFRLLVPLALAAAAWPAPRPTVLDAAMHRIYSFEFAAGQSIAAAATAEHREDPLPPAVLASAHLFAELDRLQLLDGGPGTSKPKAKPDARVWQSIQDAAAEAERRAHACLKSQSHDADSLLALMLAHGARRDYLALVDKSYRASWVEARQAQAYALQLRQFHPDRHDAFFTIGFSDYLISTVPFVFRPFMKMPEADGNRARGIRNLEAAAQQGRFLKGFARILLVNIYRKEGRREDARRLLRELAQEYPVNRTIQRELSRSEAAAGGF